MRVCPLDSIIGYAVFSKPVVSAAAKNLYTACKLSTFANLAFDKCKLDFMITDEQLWLMQLEKGEDNAFRELFNLFYARLAAFACRFVTERTVAEDIVQDVLYELWERKLHFENLLALKSCLYNMVRNRCLDIIKHHKVEEKYFREQSLREDSEFFLHRLLEDEVYAQLKEAVNALPPPVNRIFQLSLDGYDNPEIAEILHLSVDAVKSHKKRGKKILQDRLKGMVLWYVLFHV